MEKLGNNYHSTFWIQRHALDLLRLSVAIVFLWFGLLKFFDATAYADDIAVKTISTITFGIIDDQLALLLLATLETGIGLGLMVKKWLRYVIPILFFQLAGAVLPIFIFPDDTWASPFVPTLLGQYIIKNVILVAVAIVLGVVAKGGKLISDIATKEALK